MNELFESIKAAVEYIQTAPLSVLTILFLNALGYGLKFLPWVPNRIIPLVLMLAGAAVMVFLAPVPAGRNPLVLLGLMGWIFGCIAWLVHAVALRRLEKYLPKDPSDDEPPTNNPGTSSGGRLLN